MSIVKIFLISQLAALTVAPGTAPGQLVDHLAGPSPAKSIAIAHKPQIRASATEAAGATNARPAAASAAGVTYFDSAKVDASFSKAGVLYNGNQKGLNYRIHTG